MCKYLILLLVISGACTATAQEPGRPNDSLNIEYSEPVEGYELSWWGQSGRTYFIRYSEDLKDWFYVPFIEYVLPQEQDRAITWVAHMTDASIVEGVYVWLPDILNPPALYDLFYNDLNEDRFFMQLVLVDSASVDPLGDDFDGDGHSNMIEVSLGADPLNRYADEDAAVSIDKRLVDADSNVALDLFTTMDHVNATYIRNPDCWIADIDTTCISPWNSQGGASRAGTLISPRHIIFAAHHPIAVGTTIRFVDSNNNVVERTMIAKEDHPDYVTDGQNNDIAIGILDQDVPSSIGFAKVLPDSLIQYFEDNVGLPLILLDQFEQVTVANLGTSLTSEFLDNAIPEALSVRNQFYRAKVIGDSGNPSFIIVNNELVVLSVLRLGGVGAGSSIHAKRNDINTMMSSLGGNYQLTEISLSSYIDIN
ncbi:MAG: hypothetical protein AAFX93_19250 [Verrucomicrobiota bacterium]